MRTHAAVTSSNVTDSNRSQPMKKFWQSKTLWFNVAALGNYAAQFLGFPSVDLSPEVVAGVNVFLRLITNKGVTT